MALESSELRELEFVCIGADVFERYDFKDLYDSYDIEGYGVDFERLIPHFLFKIFYSQLPFLEERLGLMGGREVVRELSAFADTCPELFVHFHKHMDRYVQGEETKFMVGPQGPHAVIQVLSGVFVLAARRYFDKQAIHEHYRRQISEIQEGEEELVRIRIEEEVNKVLREDPMTGLLSRKGIEDDLCRELRSFESEPFGGLYLAMMDLCGFKQINDTYGHVVGDKALKHVANILAQVLRPSDSIARLGGDEYQLLLKVDSEEQIRAIFDRVINAFLLDPLVLDDGRRIILVPAFGVAKFSLGETSEDLIKRADDLMYLSKTDAKGGENSRTRQAKLSYMIEGSPTVLY